MFPSRTPGGGENAWNRWCFWWTPTKWGGVQRSLTVPWVRGSVYSDKHGDDHVNLGDPEVEAHGVRTHRGTPRDSAPHLLWTTWRVERGRNRHAVRPISVYRRITKSVQAQAVVLRLNLVRSTGCVAAVRMDAPHPPSLRAYARVQVMIDFFLGGVVVGLALRDVWRLGLRRLDRKRRR